MRWGIERASTDTEATRIWQGRPWGTATEIWRDENSAYCTWFLQLCVRGIEGRQWEREFWWESKCEGLGKVWCVVGVGSELGEKCMNWKMEELLNEQDWCHKVPEGPYSPDTLHSRYLLCSIFWYSTLIRNPLQTAWVLVIIWANFSSLISSRRPSRPALKKTWKERKSHIIPRLQERQTRQMVLGSAVSK